MGHTQQNTLTASRRKDKRTGGLRRAGKDRKDNTGTSVENSPPVVKAADLGKIIDELHKYKQMVDFANHGCAIADVEGNLLYVNDSFARMHGYEAGKLIGKNLSIFHNTEQLNCVRAANTRLKKTGKGLNNEEIWHKHRDGTVFPTLMSTWLLKDKNGRHSMMCATAVDISRLRQREKELEASKKILRTMLNASGELIALTDRDIKLIDVNENMAKALGLPREKLIGRCGWDFMPQKIAAARRARAEKMLATGKPITFFDDGGRGRVYNTSYYPLAGSDGKVTGMVVFAKDITEQKRVESEAQRYKEELLKLRRHSYLDLLSAMIGHQLSQPLTIMNLLIDETLKGFEGGKFEKEKTAQVLKTCLQETKSAAETIERVREHTKQWMKGRIERFAPGEIIQDVISTLEPKAMRAKMRIEVMDLKSLPVIPGYRNAFEQIVLNMAENAIEAADGKKWHRLVIRAKKMDDNIELSFSDDCCGIPEEDLEKIFEPFYSTKAHRGGKSLGLGLPIVRRILTTIGGEIRVESTAGKGTTFYVNWPLK